MSRPAARSLSGRFALSLALATPLALGVITTTTTPANAAERWEYTDLSLSTDSAGLAPVENCCFSTATIDTLGDTVALAWVDTRADDPFAVRDSDVELRRSIDRGRTWGPLLNLSHDDGARVANGVDVALSSTSTVVSYGVIDDTTFGQKSFELVRVAPDGTSTRTSLPASDHFMFSLASNTEQSYHLARTTGSSPTPGLEVLTSDDDGRTWDSTTVATSLATEQGFALEPKIAADGDVVAVAYAAPLTSGPSGVARNEIWVATSTNGGESFTAPTRVTNTPQGESVPDVAVRGNQIALNWVTRYTSTSTAMNVASSSDAGSTWSQPTQVVTTQTSDSNYVFGPQVVATDTGFLAVTQRNQSDPSKPDPGLFVSSDAQTWSPYSGAQSSYMLGDLATLDGGNTVVWGYGSSFIAGFDDTEAPVVTFTKTPARLATERATTFAYTLSDADSRSVTLSCTLNGRLLSRRDPEGFCAQFPTDGAPFPESTITSPTMPLRFDSSTAKVDNYVQPDKTNELVITATDQVGNVTRATFEWVVDVSAPRVAVSRLPTQTTKPSVPLTIKGTDTASGVARVMVRMRVGNGAWKVPSKWANLPATATIQLPLKRGTTYTFSAAAVDKAGRVSEWTQQAKVKRLR